MKNQNIRAANHTGEATEYAPLLFSTLALSWLVLSGYALFIYLSQHYGVSRKAIPCFVAWDIQLILTHLAVVLARRTNRHSPAVKP